MKVVAERTTEVGSLIYYPFIIILLLVLARSPLFDNWSMPPGLLIINVIALIYATYCAVSLRRMAENVRERAVKTMTDKLIALKGHKEDMSKLEQQIEMLRERVTNMRDGAFCSLTHQPFFKALILLFGGASGMAVVQTLLLGNLYL